jgi:hypothetical protein
LERQKEEQEREKQAEIERQKRAEQQRVETQKRLEAEAQRKHDLEVAEAAIKEAERLREQERKYETLLEHLVQDPNLVTEADLKDLGDDVKKLKQEAENRITKLPRDKMEIKLALIRGDHLSDKTFAEVKETTIGLHGNLQSYIEEVNKIPIGGVAIVQNQVATSESGIKIP